MKILACASFDYMKLMVVELQHQLAELEEAERAAAVAAAASAAAASVTADEAGAEPKPPPRQRMNPFDNQVLYVCTGVAGQDATQEMGRNQATADLMA